MHLAPADDAVLRAEHDLQGVVDLARSRVEGHRLGAAAASQMLAACPDVDPVLAQRAHASRVSWLRGEGPELPREMAGAAATFALAWLAAGAATVDASATGMRRRGAWQAHNAGMPSFGDFTLRLNDGSHFVFRNAFAVHVAATVIDWTIRVVTRDHGEFVFALRGPVEIEGDVHEVPEHDMKPWRQERGPAPGGGQAGGTPPDQPNP